MHPWEDWAEILAHYPHTRLKDRSMGSEDLYPFVLNPAPLRLSRVVSAQLPPRTRAPPTRGWAAT
jgi:hypothetical protein